MCAVAAIALLSSGGRADAGGKGREGKAADTQAQQVRAYLDKAGAAYALGHYGVAAENYEKAFELKPDAGVLYNAAQAYRLAGNKERALDVYQGYIRMYGSEAHPDVEERIAALKQAIEKDRAAVPSPSLSPAPLAPATSTVVEKPAPASAPATPEPPIAPAPKPVEAKPVLVAQASPPSDEGSMVTKPWFWIVIGGAVAAAVVGGLLLARREPPDPTGSLPIGTGN